MDVLLWQEFIFIMIDIYAIDTLLSIVVHILQAVVEGKSVNHKYTNTTQVLKNQINKYTKILKNIYNYKVSSVSLPH